MKNRHINILIAVALLSALASLPWVFVQQSKQALTLRLPTAPTSAVTTMTQPSSDRGQVLGFSTDIPGNDITASAAQLTYVNPFGNGSAGSSSQPAPASAATAASAQFDALIAPVMAVQSARVGLYPRGFFYPMAELGGCGSQQDCFRYCQVSSNLDICQRLAVINGIAKPSQQPQVLGVATDASSRLLQHCSSYADCVSYCQAHPADANCRDLQKVVANATQNAGPNQYSFPDLDQYFSTAKNQASNQSSLGQVLAANIDALPDDQAVQDCLNKGFDQNLGTTNPISGLPAISPAQVAILREQQEQCRDAADNFAQDLSDGYQQQSTTGKQSSTNSIFNLQQCITKSTNLSADLQACLQNQAD